MGLFDAFGGGHASRGVGVSPITLALAGLLDGLSGALPEAIDKLTPNGRVPSDEEISRDA